MSATLVGDLNAGLLCPEIMLSVGLAGTQLQANLTAALAIQAQIGITPPTLAAQLAVVLEAVAALQAGIALGLPGVSISASVAADLVLNAQIALGNLSILIGLLGGPSMFVYQFSGGTVATLGTDIASGLVAQPPPGLPPSAPVQGLLLGASPGAWAGITAFFGGL